MRARKIIAFLIVAAGLGTAIFIAEGSPKKDNSSVSSFFGEKEIEPGLQFELTRTQPGIFGNLDVAENRKRNENLTDAVAQGYLGKFLDSNLNAPEADFTEEAIQEQIAKGITFEEFDLEDIKTSDDNSTESQIAYMESVDSLLRKNFPGFKKNITDILDDFIQKGDSGSLDYLVSKIPGYVDGLLKLEVPSLWGVYHLQFVNLWQKKLVAYQAILDIQKDPLKSYVAIQEVPNIISEDLTLQAILIERYEELNT